VNTIETRAAADSKAVHNEYLDPANPFSRQHLLEKSLQQEAGSIALQFGSGHLYSGGMEQRQGEHAFEGQQRLDVLLREYEARQQDIARSAYDSTSGLQMDAQGAIFDATQANALNAAPAGGGTRGDGKRPPRPGPNFDWNVRLQKWVKRG
jgi:hypothetical protein